MLKDLSDKALMAAYLEGDSSAFELIYARYSRKIMSYLRGKLRSVEEQEEVFQLVFLKFHNSRRSYDSQYPLLQWLYVIARSVYLDHLKQVKRRNLLSDALIHENKVQPDHKAESLSAFSDLDTDLLATLDGVQKEVVEQRVYDESSFEEIAAKLNLNTSNVRQILSRAMKKLRLVEKFSKVKR